MATLRLPISFPVSPSRTLKLRVNSLHPLLRKPSIIPQNSLPKHFLTHIFPITCHSKTTDHHDHNRQHCHRHRHHHHHCHHNGGELKLTKSQLVFEGFAKAIKWSELADMLREHLGVCCVSTALLLAATACPYLVSKAYVKHIQQVLALVAFPLVGVINLFKLF